MNRFLLFAVAAALAGCSSSSNVPTDTTPVTTPPPTTVAAAPSPAPVATLTCNLPPSNPSRTDCPRWESGGFLPQVEASLDQLIRERPDIFDLNDGGPCGTCYRVKDEAAYEKGVIRNLQARGLCAVGGEEFGVKNTNDWNEQYDLLTASMHIRRQGGAYRATCYPAAF